MIMFHSRITNRNLCGSCLAFKRHDALPVLSPAQPAVGGLDDQPLDFLEIDMESDGQDNSKRQLVDPQFTGDSVAWVVGTIN